MNMRTILAVLTVATLPVMTGCGKEEEVEVINLDRVLEIFDKVTQTPVEGAEQAAEPASEAEAEKIQPIAEEDPEKTAAFLKRFADELNKAKLISKPIGVILRQDGAIQGFEDPNKNMAKDKGEDELFTIRIDPENGRVIATSVVENQTYRRDHHYRHRHWHHGYYGYWWYGSMWGRHRRYYSAPDRNPPDYSRMTMNRKGYHSQAVQRVRSSSRGARSRGGSRSFRGGK